MGEILVCACGHPVSLHPEGGPCADRACVCLNYRPQTPAMTLASRIQRKVSDAGLSSDAAARAVRAVSEWFRHSHGP